MTDSWEEKENALIQTFTFNDFKEALEFVVKVGEIAEKHNHHPDIILQNYNEVHLHITTHDQGAITEKDHVLAKAVNEIK